jgi:hypothetical protein
MPKEKRSLKTKMTPQPKQGLSDKKIEKGRNVSNNCLKESKNQHLSPELINRLTERIKKI